MLLLLLCGYPKSKIVCNVSRRSQSDPQTNKLYMSGSWPSSFHFLRDSENTQNDDLRKQTEKFNFFAEEGGR